jgi:hypothetical protein
MTQIPNPGVPIDPSAIPYRTAEEIQRIATSTPVTEKHRYIQMRSFPSDQERDKLTSPTAARWAHMRPDSVLVASISNHWRPGCWQRIVDMILYSQTQGVYAALQEIQDRCFNPYDALGTMRNEAVLQAQIEGFEWLLMVDTDVKPERDTLIRLLGHQMPIMAPYVVEPGTGRRLFGPSWEPNQGIKPLRWTVLSMVLFRTSVFNCFGHNFWSDAVGADEGYHFMKMWHVGHQPWQDTSTILIVEGTPHYPLASNRIASEQRKALWAKINAKRSALPDRRPEDVDGTGNIDGEYHPYSAVDSSYLVTATPANELAVNSLTTQERESIMDEIVLERIEPPNRAPDDPNAPGVIEGEYLPFSVEAQKEMAQKAQAAQPQSSAGLSWGGA